MTRSENDWLARAGALADVLFVLLGANFIFGLMVRPILPPELVGTVYDPGAGNAWAAAGASAVTIGLRHLVILLLAFALLFWRTRMKPRDVGVTRAGKPLSKLIGIGIVTGAFSALPWKGLVLFNQIVPFGEGLHGWDAIHAGGFSIGVVALVAASAMVLPPLLEEPSTRGYMRGRLQLNFGPVGAAVLSGIIFIMAHGHFYQKDPLVLGLFVSGAFSAIVWAWVTYRTGSILPAIVAHSIANAPDGATAVQNALIVGGLAAIAIVCRRAIATEFGSFHESWRENPANRPATLVAVPLSIAFMLGILLLRSHIMLIAAALLVIVLADKYVGRRKGAETPADTTSSA